MGRVRGGVLNLSCYSIVYRDGRKYAVPVNSREEYLAIRDNAQNLANLSLARGGDKVAKSRLAQFNYSLAMPNRPTPTPRHILGDTQSPTSLGRAGEGSFCTSAIASVH